MIIILSILIAMALLTIGLNVGIKDFKKLRGIVEDKELTEIIKKFPSNTEICKQTLKKLNKEDVKRSYNFKCDSQEVKDYLSGLTLKGNNQKGYGVIFVDGYPLSFYKESNNQVKNLYPKGLRR